MTSYTRTPCAAGGCSSTGRVRSRFCAMHEGHITRHGWAGGRTMREEDLREHTSLVSIGLARYANTEPVQIAYQIGEALLQWTPSWPVVSSTHEKAAALFSMIRNQGITGRDLVLRTCAVMAFIRAHRERFPTRLAEDIALGRGIRRLITLPSYGRPNARTLRTLGLVVRDGLDRFVFMLLKRMETDEERARQTFSLAAFDKGATNA